MEQAALCVCSTFTHLVFLLEQPVKVPIQCVGIPLQLLYIELPLFQLTTQLMLVIPELVNLIVAGVGIMDGLFNLSFELAHLPLEVTLGEDSLLAHFSLRITTGDDGVPPAGEL